MKIIKSIPKPAKSQALTSFGCMLEALDKHTVTVDLSAAELLVLGILAGKVCGTPKTTARKYIPSVWDTSLQYAGEILCEPRQSIIDRYREAFSGGISAKEIFSEK